ncbi:MAG: Pr6Pr family membrane protein [Clostridia bacterium]|nr:Pr6Pr family membrane protein [Clostridia bacterium]
MINTTRDKISCLFKALTIIFSLSGVLLSVFSAKDDGYTGSSFARLLYFTAQSNIWIGVTTLLILTVKKSRYNFQKNLYFFRFYFTVSITMTMFVFCFLLAPFSDDSYKAWGLANILTHVFCPFTCILDFIFDPTKITIKRKHLAYAMLPAIIYFTLASILEELHVDFGRGEYFPYFFMNYHSPAGIFGFTNNYPYYMGCFYWFSIFTLIYFLIAFIYYKINNSNFIRNKTLISKNKVTIDT